MILSRPTPSTLSVINSQMSAKHPSSRKIGRNVLESPSLNWTQLSISKTFRVRESMRFSDIGISRMHHIIVGRVEW